MHQCYYNAQAGIKKLTTETGAGQWGTALSFACTLFGMEAEVWQVGSSFDQKPYRRLMMELYGSKVRCSLRGLLWYLFWCLFCCLFWYLFW